MDVQIAQMNKQLQEEIERLFRTVYHVCKTEKPFTSYPTLIELREINGLGMISSYRTDMAAKRYLHLF